MIDHLQDFPEDTTGRFNDFKNFVRSNFELCKWVGLVIVAAQVLFFYGQLKKLTFKLWCISFLTQPIFRFDWKPNFLSSYLDKPYSVP